MTKKEFIIKAMKWIKKFDEVKTINVIIKFKNGNTQKIGKIWIAKSKNFTKKELIFKKAFASIRNSAYNSFLWKWDDIKINVNDIEDLKIRCSY